MMNNITTRAISEAIFCPLCIGLKHTMAPRSKASTIRTEVFGIKPQSPLTTGSMSC